MVWVSGLWVCLHQKCIRKYSVDLCKVRSAPYSKPKYRLCMYCTLYGAHIVDVCPEYRVSVV